uniref:MARVEL domain-containing protein n=1 Tax=Eptatretus burgeri TaxID=7764 RepID=A0A8C4X0V8_EPTBU
MQDFWVTAIFFFLWLVSSSGWAKGLADVKASLAMDFIMKLIPACRSLGFNCVVEGLSMSRLNVSVVFGFLNFILWGGNLWFAYKETPWHSSPPLTAPSQPSQGQPARGVSSTPSFGS